MRKPQTGECFVYSSISTCWHGTWHVSLRFLVPHLGVFALVHITEGYLFLKVQATCHNRISTQIFRRQYTVPFNRRSHWYFMKDFPKCQQMVFWVCCGHWVFGIICQAPTVFSSCTLVISVFNFALNIFRVFIELGCQKPPKKIPMYYFPASPN